jgi:D-alanine-D-alanine ligase
MRLLSPEEAAARVQVLADKALASAGDIAAFCVANLMDPGDYASAFDRRSEYFTESELDDIVAAFRGCGFYCDVFVNEQDFMQWALGGGHRRFPRQHLFVYNTAQSGSGAGRKSLIPAFCTLQGIRTLNSNSYAVSLARHKFHVNAILRGLDIPTAEAWLYLGGGRWLDDRRPPDGAHVLSKSSYESASIGISQTSSFHVSPGCEAQLDETVSGLGQPVVVQRFIAGTEAETPVVVSDELLVLQPVGISIGAKRTLGAEFLHYDLVANDGYEFYEYAEENPAVAARLREVAASTVSALQIEGFCRVDVRIDSAGAPFVTDVSTTPHLVPHSAYGFRFGAHGGMTGLMAALVGLALSR